MVLKAPFEIPAINNEFEVLAKVLAISDDNDHARTCVEKLGSVGGIHRFEHNGVLYSVAHTGKLPGVKTSVEFNSNWYAIQNH